MDYKHNKIKVRIYFQHSPFLNTVSLYLLLSSVFCNALASKEAGIPNQTSDKDGCLSNPCKNGGSCINEINGFTCKCNRGFTGDLCQKDVGGCSSNPCKNGGSCVQGINKFMCNCEEGFAGDLCEIDIDECASNPCLKRARCVDGSNKYTCVCKRGYTGEKCEQEIDECASNPCKNKGKCVDGINTYWCACKEGYTGDRCEEIDECASDPCENDGTCVDGKNKYRCKCPKGFTGNRCETDIDECASNPCQNGGTCHQDIGKYRCICEDGFVGTRCQREMRMTDIKGQVYFETRHVVVGALFAFICIYKLITFIRNKSLSRTFDPNFENTEWSKREESRERPRYRPPPASTAKAEERARKEDIFDEQFRDNIRHMFAELRRLGEKKEEYIKKRRQEHLKEYDEKVQEIETNEQVILEVSDIPWPSDKGHADDKCVLFDYLDMSTPENKKYLRQQQIRWHPDKFSQTFGAHILESEKEAIMNRVTLISQEIHTML